MDLYRIGARLAPLTCCGEVARLGMVVLPYLYSALSPVHTFRGLANLSLLERLIFCPFYPYCLSLSLCLKR